MDRIDYKIVLCGDSNVGKTSIIKRIMGQRFDEVEEVTVGFGVSNKIYNFDDETVEARIWDTAGQDRFRCVGSTYFRGAHGAILVYDITDEKSFQGIEKWRMELEEYCEEGCVIVVCGNKSDLDDERKVEKLQGKMYSEKYKFQYLETSAKTGENLDKAIKYIVRKIYDTGIAEQEDYEDNPVIQLQNNNNNIGYNNNNRGNSSGGCCPGNISIE